MRAVKAVLRASRGGNVVREWEKTERRASGEGNVARKRKIRGSEVCKQKRQWSVQAEEAAGAQTQTGNAAMG